MQDSKAQESLDLGLDRKDIVDIVAYRSAIGHLETPPETLMRSIQDVPVARMTHAILGIAGEAGELVDQLKKVLVHDRVVDRTNLIEEMGDLMWYFSLLCDSQNITLGEVLTGNVSKLMTRYPEGRLIMERFLNRDKDAERRAIETQTVQER